MIQIRIFIQITAMAEIRVASIHIQQKA